MPSPAARQVMSAPEQATLAGLPVVRWYSIQVEVSARITTSPDAEVLIVRLETDEDPIQLDDLAVAHEALLEAHGRESAVE
jgi:hypothetical protein